MTANSELLTGLGAAFSIFLTSAGSAVASVPAGKYALQSTGILAFAPIIIAGVLAIYGIVVAVILAQKINHVSDSVSGYKNFTAGLSVGLACLASGIGMARFLDEYLQYEDSTESQGDTWSAQEEPLVAPSRFTINEIQPSFNFMMVMCFFGGNRPVWIDRRVGFLALSNQVCKVRLMQNKSYGLCGLVNCCFIVPFSHKIITCVHRSSVTEKKSSWIPVQSAVPRRSKPWLHGNLISSLQLSWGGHCRRVVQYSR